MVIRQFFIVSMCALGVIFFSCSREEGGGGADIGAIEGVSQSITPAILKMTSLSIAVSAASGGASNSIVTVSDQSGNILAAEQAVPGQTLEVSFPLEKDKDIYVQSKNGDSIQKTTVFVHAGEDGSPNQVSISETSTLALFFVKDLGSGDASTVEVLKNFLDQYSDQDIIHQAYLELSQEEGTYVAISQIFEYLESIDTATSE